MKSFQTHDAGSGCWGRVEILLIFSNVAGENCAFIDIFGEWSFCGNNLKSFIESFRSIGAVPPN